MTAVAEQTCHAACETLRTATSRVRRGERIARVLASSLATLLGALAAIAGAIAVQSVSDNVQLARVVAAGLGVLGVLVAVALVVAQPWRAGMASWASSLLLGIDGERIRTALELAEGWTKQDGRRSGSPLLVAQTVRSARPVVDQLRAIVARRRHMNLRLAVALLALSVSIYGSSLAHPEAWMALVEGDGARGPAVRAIGTLVGDQRIRIEPPEYASLSVQVSEYEEEPPPALRGSTVMVQAQPLRRFVDLRVEVRSEGDDREIVLDPSQGLVGWRITAERDLWFRYVGRDADGTTWRERGEHRLRVRPDRPPAVELTTPTGEVDVRRGQQVIVGGSVHDDIGLANVELVLSLPAGGEVRRQVAFAAHDRNAEIRETVEVDKLDLRAGEFATVFIEALDNNRFDGARRIASRRVILRMFSPEQHHARVLDALADLALRWTALLADRLERDPGRIRMPLTTALASRQQLAARENKALDALDELRARLAEDVLSRPATTVDLRELGAMLRERLATEARACHRMKPTAKPSHARRHIATIKRHHERTVAAEERAVVLMAGLAAAEHRQAIVHEGRNLERVEGKLEALLGKLAAGDENARKADAERLLDAVSSQLERMLGSLVKQLPLAPGEHTNAGASEPEAIAGSLRDHRDALATVRELLRKGKHAEALAELRRLRKAMSSVMGDLRKRAQREQTTQEAALQRLVGRLRRGIDKARGDERALREGMRPASEQHQRRMAEHLRAAVSEVMPRVRALLEDARDQVRPRRLGHAAVRASRAVARGRAALSTARAALDSGEFDGALQALAEADEQFGLALRGLPTGGKSAIEQDLAVADGARLRAAVDRLSRAATLLREALPSAPALLDPGMRRRLRELQPRQRGVRTRLRRVRQRLARDGSAHPALQRQVGARLDHALQLMGQTEGALRRADAPTAMEQSAEADAALEAAARLLADPGKRNAGSSRSSGVGFAMPRRPIKLRSGNATDNRDDFRRRLIEAMKTPPPPAWKERLRRYYKAIAR